MSTAEANIAEATEARDWGWRAHSLIPFFYMTTTGGAAVSVTFVSGKLGGCTAWAKWLLLPACDPASGETRPVSGAGIADVISKLIEIMPQPVLDSLNGRIDAQQAAEALLTYGMEPVHWVRLSGCGVCSRLFDDEQQLRDHTAEYDPEWEDTHDGQPWIGHVLRPGQWYTWERGSTTGAEERTQLLAMCRNSDGETWLLSKGVRHGRCWNDLVRWLEAAVPLLPGPPTT